VFASALYHAGESAGKRDVLEKAVADSYSDPNPTTPGFQQQVNAALTGNNPALFSLGQVADSVLAHVTDPTLQTALCNQFLTRLQLDKNEVDAFGNPVLAHCPGASFDDGSCPAISPRLP
jgi:hypothetical protein